MRTISV